MYFTREEDELGAKEETSVVTLVYIDHSGYLPFGGSMYFALLLSVPLTLSCDSTSIKLKYRRLRTPLPHFVEGRKGRVRPKGSSSFLLKVVSTFPFQHYVP